MPHRLHINWPLWVGVAAIVALLGLFIAWPMLTAPPADPTDFVGQGFSFEQRPEEQVRERGTATVTGLWFFVFGATIGSFLNVVAYRMPMGMTFVSKPSRCQYCETPILFRHNVPILGWLMLRGRCYGCRLPISPRYLMVEVLVGVMYFTLFWSEVASGGRNLPFHEPNTKPGIMWNLFTPQWDLISLFALHAFLLGVLATIALIKYDRLRIPVRLVLFSLCVGAVARLGWSHFTLLPPLAMVRELPWKSPILQPLCDVLFGLVVGVLLHLTIAIVGRYESGPERWRGRSGSIAVFVLVAMFAGWQACLPTIVIGGLVQLAITIAGIRKKPTVRWWAMSLMLGAWLTLCFWKQLPGIWLPGAGTAATYQVAALLFGLAIAVVVESMSLPDLAEEDPATHEPVIEP